MVSIVSYRARDGNSKNNLITIRITWDLVIEVFSAYIYRKVESAIYHGLIPQQLIGNYEGQPKKKKEEKKKTTERETLQEIKAPWCSDCGSQSKSIYGNKNVIIGNS